MTQTTEQLRAEYDAILCKIAARASTVHFAHAAVCTMMGLIGLATSAKLWADFGEDLAVFSIPVAVLAASTVIYAMVRFFLGRRALNVELIAFEKLQKLRGLLGFDDPRALLP